MFVIKRNSPENKPKISTRLFLALGFCFLVAGIIMIYIVNRQMKDHALHEAENVAQQILDRNFANHSYFSQKLKPRLFKATQSIGRNDYFDPVWMSSTYAVREIEKFFKSINSSEYYYKECAINARNPENESDDYERAFLKKLNADPGLILHSDVRKIDGRPFLVVLRRGEVIEESCMRCHSTPDKAPADLVRTYGPDRSFNRRIGEIVSAISIRVPLSVAYREVNRLSVSLSVFLVALLSTLFLILFWINNRFIFKPLSVIREKALQISSDEEYLGEEIPLPSGKELHELTSAFNSMSRVLRYHVDDLKKLVDLRKRSEEDLRELSSKLFHAQDEERKRIGYELHDGIAQTLGALKIRTESALKNAKRNKDSGVADSLSKSVPLIQEVIEEIRRISKNLHPSILDDLGIKDAIIWLADEYDSTHEVIHVTREIDITEDDVSDSLKTVIFRVSQEALNNVAKHSKAASVSLSLIKLDGIIELTISDNGVGFERDKLDSAGISGNGLGLSSMRERTRLSGGQFTIESTRNKGTTLIASWPAIDKCKKL